MSRSSPLVDSARVPAAATAAGTPFDDPLAVAARDALAITLPGGGVDNTLWQRAVRIERLTRFVVDQPEMATMRCDRRALFAAALFYDCGEADDVRSGRQERATLLLNPPDTRRRERSADLLIERTRDLLSEPTRLTAARAIRESGNRRTTVPEAMALAEAVELDGLGPIWLAYEFRRGAWLGQGPREMVETWRRQQEYGYWEARIRDQLRFAASQRVARRRLPGLAAFLETLHAQLESDDLAGPRTR